MIIVVYHQPLHHGKNEVSIPKTPVQIGAKSWGVMDQCQLTDRLPNRNIYGQAVSWEEKEDSQGTCEAKKFDRGRVRTYDLWCSRGCSSVRPM